MTNIPEVKLGIVAVSRDCFPIELSQTRRAAVTAACAQKGLEVYECQDHRGERERYAEGCGRGARLPAATPWSYSWATLAPRPPRP